MQKRIGSALILVSDKISIFRLNALISDFSDMIIGRQGIPLRERGISVISLVFEGTTDQIGAFTGKIGRLDGIQVKSIVLKPTVGD
jgi:putative iron-only hydrogenase system regulator